MLLNKHSAPMLMVATLLRDLVIDDRGYIFVFIDWLSGTLL